MNVYLSNESRILTRFSGELSRILVTPQAVSLFHENEMRIGTEQFHASDFPTVR